MKCNKCGEEIEADAKYCGKCGNKVKNKYDYKQFLFKYKYLIIGCIVIVVGIMVATALNNKEERNINNQKNTNISTNQNNKNTTKELEVLDFENKEFKINAQEFINALIEADKIEAELNRETTLDYEICSTQTSGNYNVYAIGNKYLHGTLVDYPFLILENKTSKNVARINIYYAYNAETGTEFNTNAVERNYSLLTRALENLNEDELKDVILTIKDKFERGQADDIPVKGLAYGILPGSKNNFGNYKGIYLGFGTTMESLY